MGISATRNRYLDKETNVAVLDVSDLQDNQIYNAVEAGIDKGLEYAKEGEELLGKLNKSLDDLGSALESGLASAQSAVMDSFNEALDKLSSLEMPDMVKNIWNKLKELDFGGVKGFIKDLIGLGRAFLCNSLDFLKLLGLGITLTLNIFAGVIMSLLFGWFGRICKKESSQQVKSSSKIKKLEMISPGGVIKINAGSALGTFTKTVSDYAKSQVPISLKALKSPSDFIDTITGGNVKSAIKNLREAELKFKDKKTYQNAIQVALKDPTKSAGERKQLLQAQGDIRKLPLVSLERRTQKLTYEHMGDQMGAMAKAVVGFDMNTINKQTLSETERSLVAKMNQYKANVSGNGEIMSRPGAAGSYSNYDFKEVVPEFTPDEQALIDSKAGKSNSHRVHDLHPTTVAYIGA
jgi:hypothetical protein